MRIVVGMDWSEQAFTAVQAATQFYIPSEVTLVHGVDLRAFESSAFAPAITKRAYDELRTVMVEAGQQLLERGAALVPPGIPIKRVCDLGNPASVVLDAADKARADLVVVGARGRGRVAELVLGSVSHRVLTHATCPILVVKRSIEGLRRVLVGLDASDESAKLRRWLREHPFREPVELSLVSVIPTVPAGMPVSIPAFEQWQETAYQAAQHSVKAAAAELSGPAVQATGHVLKGDPAAVIAQESRSSDLVVVGAHGYKGLDRFLMGSVSHHLSHVVPCSVLVVR